MNESKNVKALKKQLAAAIAMVCVAAVALGSSTYAWFVNNTKVTADNVSIAFTNSNDPYLTPDKPQNLPKVDESGNPWWLALILSGLGLIIIFKAISSKVKQIREENEVEVEALRQKALEQERQLNDINSRASQLTQRQSELAQDLMNQQNRQAPLPQFDENLLIDSLDSLSNDITEDAADNIKSWIEEGSTKGNE